LALALVPLVAFVFAARWVLTFRARWLAALGLGAALLAAALHQFGLTLAILVLLLLARLLVWRELLSRPALPFMLAVAAGAVFWTAYGLLTHDWLADAHRSELQNVLLLGYEFVRFPDFVVEVALPWARAVPVLGLALFLLIAAACIRMIVNASQELNAERVVLVLLLCLVLAASASSPPRHETRYVFFLYPLAVIIGLLMLSRLATAALRPLPLVGAARPALLASLVGLGGFALTEDFDPHHLRYVDSEAVQMRTDMKPALAQHFIGRANARAAADWLSRHVAEGDIVIDSFQSLDFYYPQIDYFYMSSNDPRFGGWTCRGGTIERWGNTPLLYSATALQAKLQSGRRVYFVLPASEMPRMLPIVTPYQPKVVWSGYKLTILQFESRSAAPATLMATSPGRSS
jgi:hypothetical protein